MPSRRTLLASLGAALTGLTGCFDTPTDRSAESATPTPTPTATTPTVTPPSADPRIETTLGESVDIDGATVTVTDVAGVHSYQYLSAPDAFGVESADHGRFLFVGVAARGERPPPAHAFGLFLDGKPASRWDHAPGPTRDLAPIGQQRYDEDTPQGYLCYLVPAPLEADTVTVVLGRAPRTTSDPGNTGEWAQWSIPHASLEPLRSPAPEFTVSHDVPDAVGADDPVPVRVDVTNEGGPGVCRGAINQTGPMYAGDTFSLPLDSGESATHESAIAYHVGESLGVDRLQFEVVVPDGSRSFTVRLDGAETETASRLARRDSFTLDSV